MAMLMERGQDVCRVEVDQSSLITSLCSLSRHYQCLLRATEGLLVEAAGSNAPGSGYCRGLHGGACSASGVSRGARLRTQSAAYGVAWMHGAPQMFKCFVCRVSSHVCGACIRVVDAIPHPLCIHFDPLSNCCFL